MTKSYLQKAEAWMNDNVITEYTAHEVRAFARHLDSLEAPQEKKCRFGHNCTSACGNDKECPCQADHCCALTEGCDGCDNHYDPECEHDWKQGSFGGYYTCMKCGNHKAIPSPRKKIERLISSEASLIRPLVDAVNTLIEAHNENL